MPKSVKTYVKEHYSYKPDFYINFFEVCESLTKGRGRIGMLVPRTFMYKRTFEDFRTDFIGEKGAFDFLAEYGIGVLDNATVRTVGTVVRRSDTDGDQIGDFYRLHDLDKEKKESGFLTAAYTADETHESDQLKRHYQVPVSEFAKIPGGPISYWVPKSVRDLFTSEYALDSERGNVEKHSAGKAKVGMQTGYDDRFARQFWEVDDFDEWVPYAKGGTDAWVIPQVDEVLLWSDEGREVRRFEGSYMRNDQFYFSEALVFNRIKETGRRFGYLSEHSVFSDTGMVYIPDKEIWKMLGYKNSELMNYLMISLTIGRHWNVGEVGRVPWPTQLESVAEIEVEAKRQYQAMLNLRSIDPNSPYYAGSSLLPADYEPEPTSHPHRVDAEEETEIKFDRGARENTIQELARRTERMKSEYTATLERSAHRIDDLIYAELGLPEEVRPAIRQEIFIRTAEGPEDREIPDPESIPEIPEDMDKQVKDLVHHFAMEAVRKEADGIIPLHGDDDQADMLDRIVERFEEAYGEYANDRLVEVDNILGAESATEEAYPNLRAFIAKDLFDYHVNRMRNTPILWRFTTERLIADSRGEGFGCFVNYHSLDSGLLDRLANQYLEPRKAELRERRSAANRRRSDDSLSASEQSEAAEQYERCTSGLDQIAVFEDVLQTLGSPDERDFNDDDRQHIEELAPKVAAFRKETRKRVETLVELRELKGDKWFQDTFSDNFWNAVDEWREEWIDALHELERACEEYAKPATEPVEAHLFDLFVYFNERIKGSDHYSSSGILFMTYYFEREGADLLDEDGEPYDNLTDFERLLASLATGLDDPSVVDEEFLEAIADDEGVEEVDDLPPLVEFKALAEEIDDRCQTIKKRIPSDWSDRALSEITTEGYQPNHKHGVEINITPLAQAEVVPKTVEDDVI